MAVCIVAVSGGGCLTCSNNNLFNKTRDKENKAQKWIIERDEGDSDKLAFKSEANGRYLHATNGTPYGAVTTGARQWWSAESGPAPGSFW